MMCQDLVLVQMKPYLAKKTTLKLGKLQSRCSEI